MDLTAEQYKILDEASTEFQTYMVDAGGDAWNRVDGFIKTMDLDPNGYVSNGERNVQIVDKGIAGTLWIGENSSDYVSGVDTLKDALEPLRLLTDQYYKDTYGGVTPETERMAKGLVTTMKNDIDQYFSEAYFNRDVLNPAIAAAFANMNGTTTLDAMTADMQHRIQERFLNFSTVKFSTMLQQFIRRLNSLYAQGLTLTWVRMDGPVDKVIRHFCDDRIDEGPYYHIEEVKNWPKKYAPWDGMIPYTDRGSIFVNLGGYNCRHNFIFVEASEVPEKDKQRARAAGLI